MIVDCHTHIDFSDDSGMSSSKHLSSAETVDTCIVLANAAESAQQVNKKLGEYVGQYKEKMVGFAFIDPTEEQTSIKKLTASIEKPGLKGIVLYCSRCGFHPAHSRAMRLYEAAEELGLPVFFHNSVAAETNAVLDYSQPYLLDEVARRFGGLKIVVGNMGAPFVEQTLTLAAKHKNVYADLTIMPSKVWGVYNMVVAAYENNVMDKLLFGSGFPDGNAQQCIETLLGFNKLLADTNLPTVPRGNIRNIVERNSLELLGIER